MRKGCWTAADEKITADCLRFHDCRGRSVAAGVPLLWSSALASWASRPLAAARTCTVLTSLWGIHQSLCHHEMLLLSLGMFLVLKSTFSDVRPFSFLVLSISISLILTYLPASLYLKFVSHRQTIVERLDLT